MPIDRSTYEVYVRQYRLLGVERTAEPDEIKQAFRARIKKHHPDTAETDAQADHARELIEAYRSIKDAPLATVPEPAPDTIREAERDPRVSRTGRRYPDMRGRDDLAYRMGKMFGEEIFGRMGPEVEAEPGRPRRPAEFHDFWSRLAEGVYADDEEAAVYGDNSDVREIFPNRPRKRDPLDDLDFLRDDVKLYYKRAEFALRDVVTRFERRNDRGRKGWARDYLGRLQEVQVLFRDLQRRYPILNTRAGGRVRQITELASEIKKMLR